MFKVKNTTIYFVVFAIGRTQHKCMLIIIKFIWLGDHNPIRTLKSKNLSDRDFSILF